MSLKQLLEDWIGENEQLGKHGYTYGDTSLSSYDVYYGRNDLREELKSALPSLLAKIERHVLEGRKDELEPFARNSADGRHYAQTRIDQINALLNTKGSDEPKLRVCLKEDMGGDDE